MKGVFLLIKDPYIGMPLVLGSNHHTPGSPSADGNSVNSINSQNNRKGGCGPLGDIPELNWQGGGAGNAAGFDAMYLGSLPLASAYTPVQQWKTTYTLAGGLQRGTIFPELDLPFEGGRK